MVKVMNAAANLIHAVVDYAGVFPPAGLPLDQVIQNYANYVGENRHQMLGRLVIPAGQLGAFEAQATKLNLSIPRQPWPISALVRPWLPGDDGDAATDLASIHAFNTRQQQAGQAVVDTMEVKVDSAEAVDAWSEMLPENLTAFLEIDWREDPGSLLQRIATASKPNLKAKIRSGGMTPDLIPDSSAVARFIARCVEHDVGFKATAGLHHPIRGDYRLTYQPDAEQGTMHGFVNVFVGACLAFAGQADQSQLVEILDCSDRARFVLSTAEIKFDSLSIDAETVRCMRDRFVVSFGSCSFEEPSEEVTSMLPTS